MGWWDYKNIGVDAKNENKRYVEKIFEYIGYTTEPADTGEGYAECTFGHPDVYGCVESGYDEQSGHVKVGFKSFGAKDLLYLMNALFPKTSVYVHTTEGNTVSDTWESHNRIYNADTMTLECKDSYTDYGGDGPNGERSWEERFALKAPKVEYVRALIDLSSADGNEELTALLLVLSRKLTEGLITYEDDISDARTVGEEYDVEEEGEVDEYDDAFFDEPDEDNAAAYDEKPKNKMNASSNPKDFVIRGEVLKRYKGHDEHVVIPDGVTVIAEEAFMENEDIQSVVIPEGVETIEESAFASCESLECVTLPTTLTSVAEDAFGDGVSEIHFNGSFETWRTMDKDEWEWLYWAFQNEDVEWYFNGEVIKEVVIPLGVSEIEDNAFKYCGFLENIRIPEGVESIGESAFANCAKLTSITIPKGVKSIGNEAFRNCSGLTEVELPDGLISIGDRAFSECTGMTRIIIPDSITRIGEYAFSKCESLTGYIIPEGVTRIEAYTFDGCGNLKSLLIPDSVTSIGKGAFNSCCCLTTVTIPKGVPVVDSTTFFGCYHLKDISIPAGVASIEWQAFFRCSQLTEIVLPDSVKEIKREAFKYCTALSSIVIPDGVKQIEDSAFENCKSLTTITIPKSVSSIGERAFAGCVNLKKAIIPKELEGEIKSKSYRFMSDVRVFAECNESLEIEYV